MKFLAIIFLIAIFQLPLTAQTNPEPFDLAQGNYVFTTWNPTQPAGTYPPNMRFHRSGTRTDPLLTTTLTEDYTDSYNLTAGARISGKGERGFSFRNAGNTRNYVGAAVLAIRTVGVENVLVSWEGGTEYAAPRDYRIRLQYRVGTSGEFIDVPGPVEYVKNTSGHSQTFGPTLLPPEVGNQEVVQLRWFYFQYPQQDGGERPELRVGNILVQATDNPGSGSGTAVLSEDILRGGTPHTLEFTIQGTIEDVILTHVDVDFPSWAQNLSPQNITVSQENGQIAVENTTVRISDVTITNDQNLVVTVSDFFIPDMTEKVEIPVRTGAGSPNTIRISQVPSLLIWGTPMPVAEASMNDQNGVSVHLGEWITIRGVITVSDQFRTGTGASGPSYLQDETGGFAVFSPSAVSEQVQIGDEVTIVGRVTQFFGLNQLDETAIIVEHHGSNNTITPVVVTAQQIANDGAQGVELYEGMLVRINGVTVNTSVWHVEGSGTNYRINDGTAEIDIRINHAVDFVGQPAPSGVFDVIGVVSQFRPGSPYIGGYQLMPRFSDDIIFAFGAPPIISAPPYESSATDTSITFSWRTDGEGIAEIWYGRTEEYELGKVSVPGYREEHTVTITGLTPATIYNVQLLSIAGEDTVRSANYITTTMSPPEATQAINVYFNQSVDHSLAAYEQAVQNKDFRWHYWERIRNAKHSVDLAFYSFSGEVRNDIIDAIITARDNGAQVRIIVDDGAATQFSIPGVPVLRGGYRNGLTGLHHNKFAIIDYYGGEPDEVWLLTSSWNATNAGTYEHRQNMIEFQCVAIAGAYTREFEQMWGSSGPEPDPQNARFGPDKKVVNPTVFWIGDAYIRLLFSPQGFGQYGSVEQHIIQAINGAEHSINLGLNLITRWTIADAMKARHDQGVIVRGVIGDPSYEPALFNYLSSWGDVHQYPQGFGLLHHKYAILDAENTSWNGVVITGSHNWSRAANERNDENTLIIQSPRIANLYLQEFGQRYKEAGGAHDIVVSVERVEDAVPRDFLLNQNYPNPFNNQTTITYSLPYDSDVTLRVYNLIGQEVTTLVNEQQPSGTYAVTFDASDLPSGVYFYRMRSYSPRGGNGTPREFVDVRRMVLMK